MRASEKRKAPQFRDSIESEGGLGGGDKGERGPKKSVAELLLCFLICNIDGVSGVGGGFAGRSGGEVFSKTSIR